jgi:hypothetical protein
VARFSLGQAIDTSYHGYVLQGAASTVLYVPDTYWSALRTLLTDTGYTIVTEQTGGSLFIPVTDGTVDSGTMASIGTVPSAIRVCTLADAATQGIFWTFPLPADWATGDLTATLIWSPGSTDAVAHTVRWTLTARPIRNGLAQFNAPTTTTFTGASAARTQDTTVYDTPTALGISPAAGDLVRLNVRRIGADGADTYVGAVNLLGVSLSYLAIA